MKNLLNKYVAQQGKIMLRVKHSLVLFLCKNQFFKILW